MIKWGYILVLVLLSISCKKETVTEFKPAPYILDIPDHFPQMPIPENNPMTVAGVDLGRHLFYERRLSSDFSISCASCHRPMNSFSDPDQFSFGVNGQQGNRNSMPLVNLGWQQSFFWDGRARTLEEQIVEPVRNPVEMHSSWFQVVDRLKYDPVYMAKFSAAFNSPVDSVGAVKAIAQFLRTMISGESKFDAIYKQQNGYALSADEQQRFAQVTNEELAGYDLFQSLNGADCFHCHNGPLMQIQGFSNNGLDAQFSDLGHQAVSGNSVDAGKFKIPTLRNIALTAPYMHDGRFSNLDEVIDHYSFGIQQSATLDPLIEFSFQGGVQLDAYEKDLLKKFLNTLTDVNFINNPAFQEP